jgi:hypothetical protein
MKLLLLFLFSHPTFCHAESTCSDSLPPAANSQQLIANSQLPPAPHLHFALTQYHQRQLAATLAEFDDATPGQWMNYVPSVGVGYNLQGQPRPTLSFSLAQIFTARRQRLTLQAKRRSIEAAHALQSQDEHRHLKELLAKLEMLNLELQTMRRLHEIDESLYQLAVIDYEAAKLAPSGFLPKRKAFLESELDLLRKEMEMKAVEGEILAFSHF